MPIFTKDQSITESTEKYICLLFAVSNKEVKPNKEPNLARVLADFPYGNAYASYKQTGTKFKTGTIQKFASDTKKNDVIALFANFYPGECKNLPADTATQRTEWFKSSLKQLSSMRNLDSLAFDYGNLFIDGRANQEEYQKILNDFVLTYELNTKSKISVIIYKNPTVTYEAKAKVSTKPAIAARKVPVQVHVAKKPAPPVVPKSLSLDLSKITINETVLNINDFCRYQVINEDQLGKRSIFDLLPSDPSWATIFSDTAVKSHLSTIEQKLGDVLFEADTFPSANEVFNAFNYCPFNKLSVVILGQDPYPTRGNAHGLSFSVNHGVAVPRSLSNIYSALENDPEVDFTRPAHGCLTEWAERGVLLLNCALTVKEGKSNSHKEIWSQLTDRIIQLISEKTSNLVFILWGSFAHGKVKLIDGTKHCILKYNHPSPMIPNNPFPRECRNFSQANDYLVLNHKNPINWSLS